MFVKGQRVRLSDKYPYRNDRVGTIRGKSRGPQPHGAAAYSVLWDGSESPSNWHEDYLIEATDTDATNLTARGCA